MTNHQEGALLHRFCLWLFLMIQACFYFGSIIYRSSCGEVHLTFHTMLYKYFLKLYCLEAFAYNCTLDNPFRKGTSCYTEILFAANSIECWWIRKNGACCYFYRFYCDGHLGRFLKRASWRFLKGCAVGAVTTSVWGHSVYSLPIGWS